MNVIRLDDCLQLTTVQRSAKVGDPGLVNFITAVAYHFCPSLPAAFTQPGVHLSADPCSTLACLHLYGGQVLLPFLVMSLSATTI